MLQIPSISPPLSSNLRTFAAMNFDLQLKEERVKPHQVTALHLIAALVFIGAGALLSLFQPLSRLWSVPLLVGGIALLLTIIMRNRWVTQAKVSRGFRIAELLVLAALTAYALINRWTPPAVMFGVAAAAIVFALYWEGNNAALLIHVDESGIHLPAGTTKRQIPWSDIEQVLLKFGTLTVNCADNRLYQWTVNAPGFEEHVFTAYCLRQVEQGRTQRDTNDW